MHQPTMPCADCNICEVLGRISSFCGKVRKIAYAAHLIPIYRPSTDGMISLHTPCV